MKKHILILAGLLLAWSAAADHAQPNILIILSDDMGYSDLGYIGGDIETPHLDSLVTNGVLFTDFYNNAKCAPSRASLMTGLSNQRTRAYHGAGDVTEGGMTIAEALGDNYTNLMIDKWHIKPKPLDLGFERYFGQPLSAVFWWPTDQKTADKMKIDDRQYTEADMTEPLEEWYLTRKDTDYAIEFLEDEYIATGKQKPFFMYYASHAPHWPLQAERADVDRYLNTYTNGTDVARQRRYDHMVAQGIIDPNTCPLSDVESGNEWDALTAEEQAYYERALAVHSAMVYRMDQELGRLFDYLKQNDLLDNTAIFFMSDNGASAEGSTTVIPEGGLLGDRGTQARINDIGAAVFNTPMRGFKSSLYEGGTLTPMIFHWPDGIGTNATLTRQTGHVYDIFPTVLDIAGIEYPQDYDGRGLHPLDGVSLLPQMQGSNQTSRTICLNYEKHSAVRWGNWKGLRKSSSSDSFDGTWQLYNLSNDRSETQDLAASYPETVATIAQIWDDWYDDVMDGTPEPPDPPEPPAVTNSLETIADTWCRSSSSGNFGDSTSMTVKSGSKEALLKFNVAALSGVVDRVTLYICSDSKVDQPAVYAVGNDWEEMDVTWETRPLFGELIDAIPDIAASNTWAAFDVTSYINTTGTYSFGLGTLKTSSYYWKTREAGAAPYLEITYHADDDADGIPDFWEQQFFGGTNEAAMADWDNDGMWNIHEYKAGTNPTNAASLLFISDASKDAAGFVVEWQSVSGKTYNVLSSANLASNVWNIVTNVPAIGTSSAVTTDTESAESYFRVDLE